MTTRLRKIRLKMKFISNGIIGKGKTFGRGREKSRQFLEKLLPKKKLCAIVGKYFELSFDRFSHSETRFSGGSVGFQSTLNSKEGVRVIQNIV